ncbi:uncharacterized protein LOC129591111 [Paramacrobiotus metropolitanus]|uniref:uncharacterized protein LOC129591111 n=1 Tax=Paramacrobiotus metropolitanus TaxID=2943436 RepID=UPI0024461E1E|nr:uncharacterized protein LOC129591111 [Paramacrobiotus metropolitanus]
MYCIRFSQSTMQKHLIFTLNCVLLACSTATESSLNESLETECTTEERSVEPIAINPEPYIPGGFRTDPISSSECRQLAMRRFRSNSMCFPMWPFSVADCGAPKVPDYPVTYDTVLQLNCISDESSIIAAAVSNISHISPRRAVILGLSDGNGTMNTLQASIVGSIRQQLIALGVVGAATPYTTARIYRVGDLVNLLQLQISSSSGLIVHKQDFHRMPRIRQISFESASIRFLEPYTFTTLPHLRSLVLDGGISWYWIDRNYFMKNVKPSMDEDEVRRLHCDCSFAWLRNFLKTHAYLTSSKGKEDVFSVASYISPDTSGRGSNYSDSLSVDCKGNFTLDNLQTGTEFSYNTGCYNLTC